MGKYTRPDRSYDFQELDIDIVDNEKPYDSYTLNKIELNNEYLQTNSHSISGWWRGGSGHSTTARIHERPFVSTNQMSSIVQIPWFRNISSNRLRIRMLIRISNPKEEGEAGSYNDVINPYIQANFAKDTQVKTWNDTAIVDMEKGIADLRDTRIVHGEWQWIQFDYSPNDDIGLKDEFWDILQIGIGNRIIEPAIGTPITSTDFFSKVVVDARQWAYKSSNSTEFAYDTAANSPELTSWNISSLMPSSADISGSVFDPIGVIPDGLNFDVMALWGGSSDSTNSENSEFAYVVKVPATYFQVRSIQIQELGSKEPIHVNVDELFKSEQPTYNEAPFALSNKVYNLNKRKVCLIPFSKGYEPFGATDTQGSRWTSRESYLRHGIVGFNAQHTFDEIGTPSKAISYIDVAINHSSFYNDIKYNSLTKASFKDKELYFDKTTSDMIDTGVLGYISFECSAQQLDQRDGTWQTVTTKTFNKKTKFIIVNEQVSWASLLVTTNQLSLVQDPYYNEGYVYKEGMMTMPGYGPGNGNAGENDRYLLAHPDNNTVITLDLSDNVAINYDPKKELRVTVTPVVMTGSNFEPGYEPRVTSSQIVHLTGSSFGPMSGSLTPKPERLFSKLVGVSVWGY